MCTDKNTSLTHRLKPVSVLAVQFSCGSSPITTNVASCMWHAYFVHGVHWFENMHIAFMATCIQDAGFLIRVHACCMHGDLHVICMFWGHWTCNVDTVCYMHVVCYTANARRVLYSQCMLHACSIWVAHPGGYLVLPTTIKIFMNRACPVWCSGEQTVLTTFWECWNESSCSELVVLYPAS